MLNIWKFNSTKEGIGRWRKEGRKTFDPQDTPSYRPRKKLLLDVLVGTKIPIKWKQLSLKTHRYFIGKWTASSTKLENINLQRVGNINILCSCYNKIGILIKLEVYYPQVTSGNVNTSEKEKKEKHQLRAQFCNSNVPFVLFWLLRNPEVQIREISHPLLVNYTND